MNRTAWLILLSVPMLSWAQSESVRAPVAEVRSTDTGKSAARARSATALEVGLADVLERLGLNAQQQNLGDILRSKLDGYTNSYYRQKPVTPSPDDPAPHQIGRMVDNLQNRLAALEEVEDAASALYASLTPKQQKTANEMLVLAIPTFSPSANDSTHSGAESRRQDGKTDAIKRSRRGGTGGAPTGPMSGN